ncbi:MAG: hypothetical protein J6U21_06625 [Bacteroidales bacterium]|nr:hypothetical protein [Bacteroidales bacterium]
MKEFSTNAVVGVSTGKKQYAPPQIEVVELDRQTMLLAGSITSSRGFRLDDAGEDSWDE